jgi:hypothetical protein
VREKSFPFFFPQFFFICTNYIFQIQIAFETPVNVASRRVNVNVVEERGVCVTRKRYFHLLLFPIFIDLDELCF